MAEGNRTVSNITLIRLHRHLHSLAHLMTLILNLPYIKKISSFSDDSLGDQPMLDDLLYL